MPDPHQPPDAGAGPSPYEVPMPEMIPFPVGDVSARGGGPKVATLRKW